MKINHHVMLGSLILGCLSIQPIYAKEHPSLPHPATQSVSAKINLNTVDSSALSQSIKGIGAKRAQAIVQYRQSHGPFKTVEDLGQVPGLGKKFVRSHLEQIKATFTL